MSKLIIIPGASHSLGGTLISLSLLIKGFKDCGRAEQLSVVVPAASVIEKYLKQAGQEFCLTILEAEHEHHIPFLQRSLDWASQQPQDWSLLLDNCIWRDFMPILMRASLGLRLSHRPVYHFCHDLALSYNPLGYLSRKLAFACLAPHVICNSHFTAKHVRHIMPDIQGILYQPVDTNKFNDRPRSDPPPVELESILANGSRIMLTPSRINQPGIVNDKNLRALIPVLAHLKASGNDYHGIIIGEDSSPDQINSSDLYQLADRCGVSDRFTILPPTFAIEKYYRYADVVITLAPREPFGRIVVEAIACGVPVVGSKTGGIGEILSHFAPQWMVDPNDPVTVAEAIIRIAFDSNTQNVLTQGKSWVTNNCSVVNYASKIIEITGLTQSNLSSQTKVAF